MTLRLRLYFALVLCLVIPATQAQSIADALQDVTSGVSVSTSDVSVMRSQSRTYVSGGGVSMRFGTKSLQLISIEPPRMSAGCNGIDMHFGGFSFISGAEIQDMVKMIMKNAVGLVVDLAIKVLCPACADAMATIRNLASLARSMAADSCQAAKAILNATMNSAGISGGSMCKAVSWNSKDACDKQFKGPSEGDSAQAGNVTLGMLGGAFSDYVEGITKMISDPNTESNIIKDKLSAYDTAINNSAAAYDAMVNGGTKAAAPVSSANFDQLKHRGNITDTLLVGMMGIDSYPQRMMLMSLTGTLIIEPKSSKSDAAEETHLRRNLAPLLKPNEAACLLTWGLKGVPENGLSTGSTANADCPKPADIKLYECISVPKLDGTGSWPKRTTMDSHGRITLGCMGTKVVDLGTWITDMASLSVAGIDPPTVNIITYASTEFPEINGYKNMESAANVSGFYALVRDSLMAAVKKAGGLQSGTLTPEERKVINLISTLSPVPIYRLVNVSAVYPDVGLAMIDSYSQVMATALSQGYIRHLMWNFRSLKVADSALDHEVMQHLAALNEILMSLDSSYEASTVHLNQQQQLWENFNMKVDGLQHMVKRQVGLLGAGGATRFSQVVAQ